MLFVSTFYREVYALDRYLFFSPFPSDEKEPSELFFFFFFNFKKSEREKSGGNLYYARLQSIGVRDIAIMTFSISDDRNGWEYHLACKDYRCM